MANFCLPTDKIKAFAKDLKDGILDPASLSKMTPEERTAIFSKQVGEAGGKELNDLFEKEFMPTKSGGKVSLDEATQITKMAQEANSAKSDLTSSPDDKAKQIEYGLKVIDMNNFIESLKPEGKVWTASNIANLPRSALTMVHFSAPFTQGIGMVSSPAFWTGIPNMFKYFASEEGYKELNASIIGHPYYDLAVDGKLGLTKMGDKLNAREEQLQSSITEHIPGIKIAAKAFNRGFIGYLNELRFSKFVDFVNAAKLRGEDVSKGSKVLKDGANFVNSFTGRGKLYGAENFQAAANAFFSPRKTTAAFEMLNPQRYLDPKISPTARIMALKQITGDIIVLGSMLSLANAMGASVNTNPIDAHFLRVKIGNTEFNPVGGISILTRLAARIIENKEITSTGKTIELGKGFKPITSMNLVEQYIISKLSPVAAIVADVLGKTTDASGKLKDPYGNQLSVSGELESKFIPITIQNFIKMAVNDPNNTAGWIGTLSSILGVEEYTTPKK